MGRRLSALLSAVSLVLCVATCVLWVRSYWVIDVAMYDFSDRSPGTEVVDVAASCGVLALGYGEHPTALYPPGFRWYSDDEPNPDWRTFGLVREEQNGGRYRSFYLPHWLAAVLFLPLPVLWFKWRRHLQQRDQFGLCPACGYDLRATPDRCPECGDRPARANG